MSNNLLTHAIDREFPELATAVALLKTTDRHFTKLLTQHDALDVQITNDETGANPIGEVLLEDLKKQRLHLKDELYHRASLATQV